MGYYFIVASESSEGATFKAGDEIGVFLNMSVRTVSFYKNGARIGVAAGADILTAPKYFPAVSLYELGHTVLALAPPPPPASPVGAKTAYDPAS